MADIVVTRTSERDIAMRNVELLLDGEFVGNLPFGSEFEDEVEPGHHTLTATNRAFSQSVEFEIEEGQSLAFQVVALPLRGLWTLVSMLGTVPSRVVIERKDDKPTALRRP